MTKHQDNAERRRFQRILFDAPVTLRLAGQEYTASLIDISLKGALVEEPTSWHCQPGDEVQLLIRLDDAEAQIDMEVKVAHIDGGRIGLQCERIDLESISHLRRLAELNLGNSELVERELSALG